METDFKLKSKTLTKKWPKFLRPSGYYADKYSGFVPLKTKTLVSRSRWDYSI